MSKWHIIQECRFKVNVKMAENSFKNVPLKLILKWQKIKKYPFKVNVKMAKKIILTFKVNFKMAEHFKMSL